MRERSIVEILKDIEDKQLEVEVRIMRLDNDIDDLKREVIRRKPKWQKQK